MCKEALNEQFDASTSPALSTHDGLFPFVMSLSNHERKLRAHRAEPAHE